MNFFSKRPLAVCLTVLILAVALSRIISKEIKYAAMLLLAVAGTAFLVFGLVRHKNAVSYIAAACLCACIGVCAGHVYYDVRTAPAADLIGHECSVRVRIDKTVTENSYTHVYEGRVIEADGEDAGFGCLLEFEYETAPERGDVYECSVVFCPIDTYRDAEAGNYYRSNGLCVYAISSDAEKCEYTGKADKSVASLFADMRDTFARKMKPYLSGDGYAFCKAVFLGDRSELSYSVKNDFSRIGISHMLALSGMHLTVLVGGFLYLLELFGVKKKISYSVCLAVCMFYVLLTGASFSVLRAGIMFGTICFSQLLGRENDSVSSLFAAMALICVFAPYAVFNAGLILSFSSTLGIVVILPEFNNGFIKRIRGKFGLKILGFFLIPVVTTLAAITFSLPAFCVFFDYISVFTVIANLLISLPLTVILLVCPFLLLFSVTVPPLAAFAGRICSLITALIFRFSENCASLDGIIYSLKYPFVKYVLLGMVLLAVLFAVCRVKSTLWYFGVLGAGIVAYSVLFVIWQGDFLTYETVTCLSNVRNDGVVITSCGKSAICDVSSGSKESERAQFDAVYDISYREKTDAYIFTHYHERAVKNIALYLREGKIGEIYLPVPKDSEDFKVYSAMISLCGECSVPCVIYGDSPVCFGNTLLNFGKCEKIKRSVHPVVTFGVANGDFEFLYFGAGADECKSQVSDILRYDAVFAGAHGPKLKGSVFLPVQYGSLVCSESAYKAVADKEVSARLDGWEKYTFVINAEGLLK